MVPQDYPLNPGIPVPRVPRVLLHHCVTASAASPVSLCRCVAVPPVSLSLLCCVCRCVTVHCVLSSTCHNVSLCPPYHCPCYTGSLCQCTTVHCSTVHCVALSSIINVSHLSSTCHTLSSLHPCTASGLYPCVPPPPCRPLADDCINGVEKAGLLDKVAFGIVPVGPLAWKAVV